MSIIISDLSFHYPNQPLLFDHLDFSVAPGQRIALVGPNGVGKSTLLQLMAGVLRPVAGSVRADTAPHYIPQLGAAPHGNVADILHVTAKLAALRAIEQGSLLQADYDALGDDWQIEVRCREALNSWQLPHVELAMPAETLSGGERTRLLLAGLTLHAPRIILLDEPTNHLDQRGRQLLYDYLHRTKATVVAVSHDLTLLDLFDRTGELTPHGIKRYGGNYTFYRAQKELERDALDESIHEQEKSLRLARKQAQEARERQQRRTARQGQQNKAQVPRIMRNTLRDSAERTAARLDGKHGRIISRSGEKLSELREKRDCRGSVKISFGDPTLHRGKLLIEASALNFSYPGGEPLWREGVDLQLFSGDRFWLRGDNGSGKSTLLRLLLGELNPAAGTVSRANFRHVCLDQHYATVDTSESILELARRHNTLPLPEHEVNLRLHRHLFPCESWEKPGRTLSGGERMRLLLCLLSIGDRAPELMVLDEPTNNLDIESLEILTQTVSAYRGSLLVISHDRRFVERIGVTGELELSGGGG